jgi:alkaline phosphatase D
MMNRRTLLQTAGLLGLGYPLQRLSAIQSTPRFSADPFAAGIASGDPTRSSVVLWTRLIPDPKGQQDWQRAAVPVLWEIASDEGMKKIVRHGQAMAIPEAGHSIHVDAQGLDANRWYWYRFRTGSAESLVGRTRTAPSRATDRFRFAFASCQQWQTGFYTAYQHLIREDIDAVVFLGDYIYETNTGAGPTERRITGEVPKTLEGYRNRYALYRSDPNLREAHRLFPWIITWDDHEVQNDYAGVNPPDTQQTREEFAARRAAAYKAHYEWLPMPISEAKSNGVYRSLSFGPLAHFMVLDERQFRDPDPCGGGVKAPCAEYLAERTMLGAAQERWLERELRSSRSRWNVVANQVMMTTVDQTTGPNSTYNMDHWDGFETARRRMVSTLRDTRAANPIVITGDIHSNWVGDLRVDYKDDKSPVIGTELVGTSISSGGDGNDQTAQAAARVAENPQIKFFNNQRGYVRCEITKEKLTADFRVVDKVSVQDSAITTRASFVVENGKPGAVKA